MDKSQELREVLLRYLDADLERIIFSNPRTRESYLKLTVRPLLLRGALAFQTEEFTEKQAFQKNQNAEKTAEYLLGELENRYRNAEIASLHGIVNILISKKGTVTIKEKTVGQKGLLFSIYCDISSLLFTLFSVTYYQLLLLYYVF